MNGILLWMNSLSPKNPCLHLGTAYPVLRHFRVQKACAQITTQQKWLRNQQKSPSITKCFTHFMCCCSPLLVIIVSLIAEVVLQLHAILYFPRLMFLLYIHIIHSSSVLIFVTHKTRNINIFKSKCKWFL